MNGFIVVGTIIAFVWIAITIVRALCKKKSDKKT